MRASSKDELTPLRGTLCHAIESSHHLVTYHLHGAPNLQLLHILRKVTTRHTLVNMLLPRKIAEFLNASLHIMTRDTLALKDGIEIYLPLNRLISINSLLRDIETEILLCFHHSDPELPLKNDTSLSRPYILHGRRCIATSQHVGNSTHKNTIVVGETPHDILSTSL